MDTSRSGICPGLMVASQSDMIIILQEREDPTLTEWDRFARAEYVRLAMEEEADDAEDAPF